MGQKVYNPDSSGIKISCAFYLCLVPKNCVQLESFLFWKINFLFKAIGFLINSPKLAFILLYAKNWAFNSEADWLLIIDY